MRIGVFTALFQNLPFEAALDRAVAAGVTAVEGQFSRGDTVSIVTPGGKEIARGLIAYDCADAEKIIGRQSSEIASLLGFSGRDEMVHRDDLVLLGS